MRQSLLSAVLFGALGFAVWACGDRDVPFSVEESLIPRPSIATYSPGTRTLQAQARVVADPAFAGPARYIAERLRPATGYAWPVESGRPDDARPEDIVLVRDPALAHLGEEGYQVEVDENGIMLRASSAAGAFYAAQTVRQLLPREIELDTLDPEITWEVPFVRIEDGPRYAWRGVMLDVARHFFSVEEVQRFIDIASRYKLNRFHLHLTDDQGWRIQIDSWPNLTEIGSRMDSSGGPGGYYTKDDYRRIVEFAAERFVMIIPEIDVPGHTNAALASYGELNPDGIPTVLSPTVPFASTSLWLDGPATLPFVEDVFREVAEITPGPYLHVGGDEAAATPPAQYREFMVELQDIIERQGKTMLGWEDIGAAELRPPLLAQHWVRPNRAQLAFERGAQIISSPARHAYLDMKYHPEFQLGTAWIGFVDVQQAYEWDPVPEGVAPEAVIGVESPLWTETLRTRAELDLLAFPRLVGHAEIGWTTRPRSWIEYRERLARHGPRFRAQGIGFYRSTLVDWTASDR